MATDERKPDKATTRTDKQDEKITDLPEQSQTEKDAQVKGGRMKLDPKGLHPRTMADAPSTSDRPQHDAMQLEDLPARPTEPTGAAADTGGSSAERSSTAQVDDDIIAIEDLTPRANVNGGRKIILGEIFPPPE